MVEVPTEEIEVVSNGENSDAVELYYKGKELTADDGAKLTKAISATSEALWKLLYIAHSTEVYKKQGFKTWKDYIDKNFSISRSAANALVTQGAVIEGITQAAPEGVDIHITQAQARDLKKVIEEVATVVAERTAGKSPEEAEEIIRETVDEKLEEINAQKEAEKAKKAEEQKKLETEQQMYEDAATEIIRQAEAEHGMYTVEGMEEPSGEPEYEYSLDEEDDYALEEVTERKATTLRNLYTTLSKASTLPDAEEALEVIPQERINKTHAELSELEQKVHDILVAIESRYGNSILRNTMSN
jgi:hypothetical protein